MLELSGRSFFIRFYNESVSSNKNQIMVCVAESGDKEAYNVFTSDPVPQNCDGYEDSLLGLWSFFCSLGWDNLGISDTGIGYKKVINGVKTTGIDFVKTHSTFSDDNQIEEVLIKQKFGDIRTVNYKLRVGHTMGASTAIETALAIQEESGKFLSLGAGMGNVFSSAVVEIL